jgi:cell division protein FtsQ
MARNQGTNSDDPFYRRGSKGRRAFADDALPLDAGLSEPDDDEDPQQFRRASKRVPVRRGALPRQIAGRLRKGLVVALVVGGLWLGVYLVRLFITHSPQFVLNQEKDIEVAGSAPNSGAKVKSILQGAVGRNIFAISLSDYRHRLEEIPWVESAAVMRLMPNHLRVVVKERTPVAFVALGDKVKLIDGSGVVMELPTAEHEEYSFPVILGMSAHDPLAARARQMQLYLRLMRELDGGDGGGKATEPLSRKVQEVDASDPSDVKVTVQAGLGPVLLHLGNEQFLPRFQVFLANVQRWEKEQGRLQSVDLRYGREVILNPDGYVAPAARAAGWKARQSRETKRK